MPTEPRPSWALAAGWHRSTPGSTLSSAPSKPQHQPATGWASWLSGQGKAGEASPGRRGRVCTNPVPLCSLQLVENSSRVDEYLDQSLPYLQSPQEPLRKAAITFIGEPQPRRASLPTPQ